ncbi:MAG: ABC transporter ATP-binding protein [Acetobacteraceae bacterium]|nr:ABC transporter ATP-binding protein [Acetobacteraceae bacterium]
MIEVRNLTKVYGRVVALDGVTFEVSPGQVVALVGPNAAGKTTLFRLLSTLIAPTSGRAAVCGHDVVTAPRRVRAVVGAVYSEPALYERLTPREVLHYFGVLYDLDGSALKDRVEELIRQLGLEEFASRLSGGLSRGIRQRVALARAVLHQPPVLLLDEPTTGLDFQSSHNLLRFLSEYRHGRCILFATHNFQEVSLLCNRLLVLDAGRLVLDRQLTPGGALGADQLREMVLNVIRSDER